MNIPSRLVEDAVNELSKLPSIGKKTALRLVLHLLKEEKEYTHSLTNAINTLRNNIQYCKKCFNISDTPLCSICSSATRDKTTVCVVENITDLLAIENTGQYNGVYHVLGGVISPIEGISPADIKIAELIAEVQAEKASGEKIKEVILALNSTMESDTTAFYITKKIKPYNIKITTIARGVPVGGELEYTDEITLGRSIIARTIYE
jgi:recombination protein RecR